MQPKTWQEVTFTLEEPNHTFSYVEKFGDGRNTFGIDPKDGTIKLEGSMSMFKGKTWGMHQAQKTVAVGGQPGTNTIAYNFTPDTVKKPVVELLKAAEWSEQKQGLFSRIFGKK